MGKQQYKYYNHRGLLIKTCMRNIVLFVFCVLLPIRSKALPVDSLILNINRASDSLKRNYTEQNQRAFFSLFPSSARRLAFVEDYLSETDNKTYIYDWFETLGNLTAIDDSSYCDKLISLSIGAQLDADAFNYLHSLLHSKLGCQVCNINNTYNGIKANNLLKEVLHQLKSKTDGEVMRFWQFYFSSLWFEEDGHHEDYSHRKELKRILSFSNVDTEMRHIIKIAYKYSSNQVLFISEYEHSCRLHL